MKLHTKHLQVKYLEKEEQCTHHIYVTYYLQKVYHKTERNYHSIG